MAGKAKGGAQPPSTPKEPQPSLIERLSAKFPTEAHEERKDKRGNVLTYIGIAPTIGRLNEVFGAGYTTAIVDWRFGADCVVVHARITYLDEQGRTQYKDGIGACEYPKKGFDIDACVKTAYAEAIKKAGHQVGVALYLWDDAALAEVAQDKKEAEQQQRQQAQQQPQQPQGGKQQPAPLTDRQQLAQDQCDRIGWKKEDFKAYLANEKLPALVDQMTKEQWARVVNHLGSIPTKQKPKK